MATQQNEVGSEKSFKRSWGFGKGSVSNELQFAAEQIVADSQLPNSDIGILLNTFFHRYLRWPYRATSGAVFDSAGSESARIDSLIYTSTNDLDRVPTDALACAIKTHTKVGIDELRASYVAIAHVKGLTKSPLPKTASKTPIADATMGIIFAADSSLSLEQIGEALQELNKNHPHQNWVDMVVVLSKGLVCYGCQFPFQPLGDFLPPARGVAIRGAMYIHIVARAHGPMALNRMCALLFYYLYLFSPGTALPPYQEILECVPKTAMAIDAYQANLSGQLVPMTFEHRVDVFPLGFNVLADNGQELGRVRYLPWQDGGVVRVTGNMPIEGVLVFAGKEALSEPVVRFNGEQFSGVIPLSRQGFAQMAERMARQSHNMKIVMHSRPNWTIELRGNEGTSSPFIARVFMGICTMRDRSITDAKERDVFDTAFEALLTGLETLRSSAKEVVSLYKDFEQKVSSGEVAKVDNNAIRVNASIDRELRKCTDEVISSAGRVMKDRVQAVLRAAKVDIGFLYKKESSFVAGIEALKKIDPHLAEYLSQTRTRWSDRMTACRINLEHGTWVLPKVRYQCVGDHIRTIEPLVEGQPVTEFVQFVADRITCFVEDVVIHALQSRMPSGISITEIPLAQRNPSVVERFRPALSQGGSPIWAITYYESRFEDH
jgi:hypothetical protein